MRSPVTREARVARAKIAIKREYKQQQSFLDFVLAHYADVGVTELDEKKLPPLLKRKYHESLTDAWNELGKPAEVGKIFVGFQKYLYQTQVGVSPSDNGCECFHSRNRQLDAPLIGN